MLLGKCFTALFHTIIDRHKQKSCRDNDMRHKTYWTPTCYNLHTLGRFFTFCFVNRSLKKHLSRIPSAVPTSILTYTFYRVLTRLYVFLLFTLAFVLHMRSLSSHPNIIRVVAMDPTLPTMPTMMEAGSMDMFDVMYDTAIPMPTKIRQVRNVKNIHTNIMTWWMEVTVYCEITHKQISTALYLHSYID